MAGVLLQSGYLYGTTSHGGDSEFGAVFRLKPGGSLEAIHRFSGTDGAYPNGSVVDQGRLLYGTTAGGGSTNDGVVFSLTKR